MFYCRIYPLNYVRFTYEFPFDNIKDAKKCCEILSKSSKVLMTDIFEDKSYNEIIKEHFEMSALEEKDIDPIQDYFE